MSNERIYIVGSIDSALYREVSEEILKLENAGVKDATIEIMSEGGDEDVGLGLYGRIKSSPINFIGIAHGGVHSAALMPYLACELRMCTAECTFLMHLTRTKVNGDYRDFEREGAKLADAENRWSNIVATRTKQKHGTIINLSKHSSILTSEEAKDYGIVHSIVAKIEPSPRRRKRSE